MTDTWYDDLGTPDNPKTDREKAFWEYHAKHPDIYAAFDRFAQDAVRAKRDTFGAQMVVERVRWYVAVERDDESGFKVDNNFNGYYARLWMRNNPEQRGLFRRRKLKAKHAPSIRNPENLAYL